MRRREEDAAVVREDHLLLLEVGDAEDEHVVEPLAGLRVDRVGAAGAMEAEELVVDGVRRPPSSETAFVASGIASASSSRSAIVVTPPTLPVDV